MSGEEESEQIMVNQDFESGNSSVKISDGAKGSTVEVKVYARPVPENAEVAAIVRDLEVMLNDELANIVIHKDAAQKIGSYIRELRSAVPDIEAAADQAAALHLRTAAQVEINGGAISYDPDQKLMAEWVSQAKAAQGEDGSQ